MARPARSKQPELVRRRLLDNAAIAARDGLAGVSIQSVTLASGVTKGGVFHHFPSKQSLLDTMFGELLERLDAALDDRIARDLVAYGRFTRAYVQLMFEGASKEIGNACAALSASMMVEPSLRRMWTD